MESWRFDRVEMNTRTRAAMFPRGQSTETARFAPGVESQASAARSCSPRGPTSPMIFALLCKIQTQNSSVEVAGMLLRPRKRRRTR